jgi:putative oxidoreductase
MTSYRETLSFFQTTFGIGPFFATLAIIAEFFGGVGLIVGFLSRLSAFGTSCTMAVATYMSYGAAMAQLKAGKVQTFAAISQFAFPALIFVVSFVILINGAGSISLDYAFFGKRRR